MIIRYVWVLLFLPVIVAVFCMMRYGLVRSGCVFPSGILLDGMPRSWRQSAVAIMGYARLIALILLVLALSRPQLRSPVPSRHDGIAIVLAIDCSSTMLAEDFSEYRSQRYRTGREEPAGQKRIDAVREVARSFLSRRSQDLIGIVAFAQDAYVVCPLTFDHAWALRTLDEVRVGLIPDGTAIGSAILSGVRTVENVRAKSKVIVLLTDGINSAGAVPPLIAAKTARSRGIRIYTIGLASNRKVSYLAKEQEGHKVFKEVLIPMNEEMLTRIAETTGGSFFKVADIRGLEQSYEQIDQLETVPLEDRSYEGCRDLFPLLIAVALALVVFECLSMETVLRRVP